MKNKLSHLLNLPLCGSLWLIFLGVLSLILSGCKGQEVTPSDHSYSSPRFSVSLDTNSEQQINATLGVRNSGDDPFPGDDSFNAVMNLWDQSGILRSQININSVQEIESDESIHLSTAHWNLTPGVYFLNWGTSQYGSVMGVFTVVIKNEEIALGASQFFPLKPADYDIVTASTGRIQAFTLDEDRSLILTGETTVPDMGHVFPLIFDASGLVEGMPTGLFASIADGRWWMEIPADAVALDLEVTYSVLLFSDDIGISPSEPFVFDFSPPVSN